MALAQRVKRLERFHTCSPCRTCHGHWPFVVSYINDDQQPPIVKGCPECGDINHIMVRYVKMPPVMERRSCLA